MFPRKGHLQLSVDRTLSAVFFNKQLTLRSFQRVYASEIRQTIPKKSTYSRVSSNATCGGQQMIVI